VKEQCGVDQHLMIKRLVALGEHDLPVQGQHPAEVLRFGQRELLVGRSPADEPPPNAQTQFYAFGLPFT